MITEPELFGSCKKCVGTRSKNLHFDKINLRVNFLNNIILKKSHLYTVFRIVKSENVTNDVKD